MGVRPGPLCVALSLGLVAAAAAAQPGAPASAPAPAVSAAAADRAVERLLPLCSSQERATRRYCIEELMRLGDPTRRARERLRDLAARDADLSPLAGRAVTALYHEPPPSFDASSEAGPLAGANLLFLYPSGFTTPRGRLSVASTYDAYWDVNYGATDWLEVGVRTTTPVGLFIFAPQVKVAKTWDGGAIGFHVLGGIFLPYWLDTSTTGLVGGGPTLSLGSTARYLNLGVEAYGLVRNDYHLAVLLPHAGAISRLTRRLSVGLDIVFPGVWAKRFPQYGMGEQAVVLYGLRITGRDLWGDISFAAPICDGCAKVYHPFVLGIPLLGLGFWL
jgi:hypothetical protein